MKTLSHRTTDVSPLIIAAIPGATRANGDVAAVRQSLDGRARELSWSLLRTTQVNALLVGPCQLTEGVVARIDRYARQPLVWWTPEEAVEVPQVVTGTLVIRDIDRMALAQQERLTQWIGAEGAGVQVLALARLPLFARVRDKRFSAALYYRLNTVVIQVRAWADLP